ncbi:MAG: choice-of-anchor tandem repeat GloVer-containing protein [Rhizomicrobium sp.]
MCFFLAMSADPVTAAAKYKVLYGFCDVDPNCSDGAFPDTGLVEDANGNVYGGVFQGGAYGQGGIYKVTPKGKETIIHSFCAQNSCADGQSPSDLIMDGTGDIFGATSSGGANGQGTVFKLAPGKGGRWKFRVLYNFCSQTQCSDGSAPLAGLTYAGREMGQAYDGQSPLFGATSTGGASNNGVAFKLSFVAGKKKPRYEVIYNFCSQANCIDGAKPLYTLTTDSNGNIFGVAGGGDSNGDGIVFQLSPNGSTYRETVLHTFCSEDSCADGKMPTGVAADMSGTLFGATAKGGANATGLVFKLAPNGARTQETVLYNFCSQTNCSDGGFPADGVTVAPNGDIFGTVLFWEGQQLGNSGLVYKVHGTKESVVHPFCAEQGCPDGTFPIASLLLDGKGILFGTTEMGGPSGYAGVLFRITKP